MTPSLGTSLCHRCSPKKTGKKEREREREREKEGRREGRKEGRKEEREEEREEGRVGLPEVTVGKVDTELKGTVTIVYACITQNQQHTAHI